jgi:hypothetical protein
MPRFPTGVLLVVVATLQALLSPDIPFYVQLYFLSKIDHGDVDAFIDEKHRARIRFHFGSDPTFVGRPDGDRVTITVGGVQVLIEFKYSKYPNKSAFAGSYGGLFHILLLHSLRGMYGQNMSIVDGHVVFTEGKVVVPIMTLHEFLVCHNFIHSTSQDHAFLDNDALFVAWSKSKCFSPSAVIHAFQKTKKRDERAMGMYNAFTTWLSSNGFNVEELKKEPMLTSEQCQQKAEEAFPEAWLHFQQAMDAEKEVMKRIEDAKNATSPTSIIDLGVIDSTDKTLIAPVSRILRCEQNKKDKECPSCQKCIVLHEKFKAMHGGGDIFSAITNTVGTEVWKKHVKEMWDIYIDISTEEECK